MSRIIFLDMDGVCNQWKDGVGWLTHPAPNMKQPWMVDMNIIYSLNQIMSQITLDDVYLVISSSWRGAFDSKKDFCYKSHIGEAYIHDDWRTITSQTGIRGMEIEEWLSRHPEVEEYVIVDDEEDGFDPNRFIQTNQEIGLTYAQMGQMLKKIGYNLQGSHVVQKKNAKWQPRFKELKRLTV